MRTLIPKKTKLNAASYTESIFRHSFLVLDFHRYKKKEQHKLQLRLLKSLFNATTVASKCASDGIDMKPFWKCGIHEADCLSHYYDRSTYFWCLRCLPTVELQAEWAKGGAFESDFF